MNCYREENDETAKKESDGNFTGAEEGLLWSLIIFLSDGNN